MSNPIQVPDAIAQYAGLLRIRQKAYARTLAVVTTLLLFLLAGTSVYVVALYPGYFVIALLSWLVFLFLFIAVRTQIDYSIARSILALMDRMQREEQRPIPPDETGR